MIYEFLQNVLGNLAIEIYVLTKKKWFNIKLYLYLVYQIGLPILNYGHIPNFRILYMLLKFINPKKKYSK